MEFSWKIKGPVARAAENHLCGPNLSVYKWETEAQTGGYVCLHKANIF